MKPLKNNWFMSKYLGITEHYDRPRTVCQLGRKILSRTIMWFFASMAVAFVVVPLVVTAYNLFVMWHTGASLETVIGKDPTFSGFMYLAASLEVIVALCWLTGLGIYKSVVALRDKLSVYNYNRRKARGFYDREEWHEPNTPVRDFFADLYKRFKDKTCVMLKLDVSASGKTDGLSTNWPRPQPQLLPRTRRTQPHELD